MTNAEFSYNRFLVNNISYYQMELDGAFDDINVDLHVADFAYDFDVILAQTEAELEALELAEAEVEAEPFFRQIDINVLVSIGVFMAGIVIKNIL